MGGFLRGGRDGDGEGIGGRCGLLSGCCFGGVAAARAEEWGVVGRLLLSGRDAPGGVSDDVV